MHVLLKFKILAAGVLATALGITSVPALAIPASSVLHALTQSDGSTFQARQWGDESLSGWENADGYTVVFDKRLNAWTYAVLDSNGALASSGQAVGRVTPPSPLHLRPTGKALQEAQRGRTARMTIASMPAGMKTVTPTGTGNSLTVLVNFPDTKPTFTKADFDSRYFSGNSSLPAYFTEQSRGAFTISSGPAGVVDWVTLSKGHDYYGADDPANSNNKDLHRSEIVPEVVAALMQRGIDFAAYDSNGDCYVDALSIIFQGMGQHESGNATDIWPVQTFATPIPTNSNCPSGGKIMVSNVTFQGETSIKTGKVDFSGFGVYAHEYGHALGLPDLYDTTYKSNGIGNWSLMSDGDSKNGDDKPIGMDPWSKLRLGWITPTMVTAALPSVTIPPVLASGTVYQFRNGKQDSGEYFLVENRAKTGFDTNLVGGGLLVWHIDGDVVKAQYDANKVNDAACIPGVTATCQTQHFGVALVQADNLWNLENKGNSGDAGDPFPGTSNVTAINDNTTPGMRLYSGAPSGLAISNIHASGNDIVASLDPGSTGSPASAGVSTGIDTYDATNNQLTIPRVAVGSTTYTNVVITVGNIISVGAAPAAGTYDTYDGTYLTIPAVSVNGTTYNNVKITVGGVVSVGGH